MSSLANVFERIFVDVVVGFQAAVWLAFLGVGIGAEDYINRGAIDFGGTNDSNLLLGISIFYSIGVILVRFVDTLYSEICRMIKTSNLYKRFIGERAIISETIDRSLILYRENRSGEYLDYLRTSMRICGATSFNSLIFLILSSSFQIFCLSDRFDIWSGLRHLLEISIVGGAIMSVVAFCAYYTVYIAYMERLEQIGNLIRRGDAKF